MISLSQCVKFERFVREKEKGILSIGENVSTTKHKYILPGVKGHIQIFPKAPWLHTNVKLESFLKLSIAPDLHN